MTRSMLPAAATPDNPDVGAAPVARAATARSEWQVLRDLLPFLRPFVGRIALALALVVAGKLANLTVPVVLKRLVDGLNVEPSLLVLPVALLVAYGASRLSVTLFTELRQVERIPPACSTVLVILKRSFITTSWKNCVLRTVVCKFFIRSRAPNHPTGRVMHGALIRIC